MKLIYFSITLISVLGSLNSNSMEAHIKRLKKDLVTQEVHMNRSSIKKGENDEAINRIMEQGERIEELLKRRSNVPVIWERKRSFRTGTVIRGVILNSIVSSNLGSPVLVKANLGQGLEDKTFFSCQGITKNKRIMTLCNRMVSDKGEREISAQVLNMDGSSGLSGVYDDQKEEMIESAVMSEFASGMLSAAGTRSVTPFGKIKDESFKNQILEGLVKSSQTTSDILIGEAKSLEPIVIVQAGTEVLVYFMEALNEDS